jgi:hypothetical protein
VADGEKVVIPGGCPDGFWSLANCERAAGFGLCSMVTKTDGRVVTMGNGVATVTGQQVVSDTGS